MNSHLRRAILLIEQSRYDLAEKELQQAFAVSPEDPTVHAYFAICSIELEKFNEARRFAADAVKLDPTSPFGFYAAAYVSRSTNETKKGLGFIHKALELDPYNVHFFAEKAALHFEIKQWQQALDAANSGLELDPEDINCLNLRTAALVKLGKRTDADTSIQVALERQPESAITHANLGWTLIEKGEMKPAMTHFREALRLEPNMEWARVGIIEAMKGQYFIYRIVLNWFLWCSKLSGQKLWMIILGGYFGYRFLMNIVANNPETRPYLMPFIIAYVAFVIMTWVSVPLFNLMLRLNRFGRMALSDQEKRTSGWVGLCLLLALFLVGWYFFVGAQIFLVSALAIALMVPALAYYYVSDEGWPRAIHQLLLVTMLFMACSILVGLAIYQFAGEHYSLLGAAIVNKLTLPLILLGVASQFGIQILATAKPRKGDNHGFWIRVVGGVVLAILAIWFFLFVSKVAQTVAVLGPILDSVPPIRIQLSPLANATWSDEAKSVNKQLEELGFSKSGDYSVDNLAGHQVRYLKNPDSTIYAEIAELKNEGLVFSSLSAIRKEDQGLICATDGVPHISPPEWNVEFLQQPVNKLFEWMADATADIELLPLSDADIPKTTERIYADSSDFLLASGGYTPTEFVSMMSFFGKEIDERTAERVLEIWHLSYRRQVDEQVMKHVRDNVNESTLPDEDILIVHLYTPPEELAMFIQDEQKREDFVKEVKEKWPDVNMPIMFGRAALTEDTKMKVRQVSTPIPAAVFDLSTGELSAN